MSHRIIGISSEFTVDFFNPGIDPHVKAKAEFNYYFRGLTVG
jgi:hypothetical protein